LVRQSAHRSLTYRLILEKTVSIVLDDRHTIVLGQICQPLSLLGAQGYTQGIVALAADIEKSGNTSRLQNRLNGIYIDARLRTSRHRIDSPIQRPERLYETWVGEVFDQHTVSWLRQ